MKDNNSLEIKPTRSLREIVITRRLIIAVSILIFIVTVLDGSTLANDMDSDQSPDPYFPFIETLLSAISILGVVGLLYRNGTLINRKVYKRIMLFFVLCFFLSQVFKVLHLPAANEILMLSSIAIFVVYCLHFITKPKKIALDYLKVLWMTMFLQAFFGRLIDFDSWPIYLGIISRFFLIVMFGVFAIGYFKEYSESK